MATNPYAILIVYATATMTDNGFDTLTHFNRHAK